MGFLREPFANSPAEIGNDYRAEAARADKVREVIAAKSDDDLLGLLLNAQFTGRPWFLVDVEDELRNRGLAKRGMS